MNFEYFFKLNPIAEAIEIMLNDEYSTGLSINEFTRDIQFREYFGEFGKNTDCTSTEFAL
jgi:hypothetical protein